MSILEVKEGTRQQGAEESVTYDVTTTGWGSNPTNVSVKAYDSGNADVTSTVFPTNTPSISGDVITLSPLKSLTESIKYRVEVKFDIGDDTYECFFCVACVRMGD